MNALVPTSALVLIPSEKVWAPIQAIRRVHDRHVRRWMPHVTLLYPFHPLPLDAARAARLREACARVEPFAVTLRAFGVFRHRPGSHTLWLDPEPRDAMAALHAALVDAFPECAQGARRGEAFVPHLSLGQVRGADACDAWLAELRARWRPLRFSAHALSLIGRGAPPDDVFGVVARIRLGRPPDA